MDARSEHGAEDDRGSVCSTAATGLSTLSSRIASLTADFDRLRPGIAEGVEDGQYETEDAEAEEEVVELTEEQVLQELDKQEPAFQVCSRLFHPRTPVAPVFKRLAPEHLDQLRQNGFVRVDNFITAEAAARLKGDAMVLRRQGRFQDPYAVGPGFTQDVARFTERTARGDHIMWLHARRPPATLFSFATLISQLQDLQDDLSQMMNLQHTSPELQLSVYPRNGAEYVRHRDAFPDDGSDEHQRKVTAIVYANPNWAPADGGKLRLWLPKTQPHSQSISTPQSPEAHHRAAQPPHTSTALANGRPPHHHAHALPNGVHARHSSLVSNASQSSGSSATGPILANGNGHAPQGLSDGPVLMNGHADDHGHVSPLDDSPRASADMHYQTSLPGPTQTANLADIHPQTMRRLENGHAHAGPARAGVHFADDLVNMHLPHGHAGQHGHSSLYTDDIGSDAPSTPRGAGSSALADHASDQASSKSDPPEWPRGSGSIASSLNVDVPDRSSTELHADAADMLPRHSDMLRDREARVQERTEVGLEPVVDVAPIAGRLVLMMSGAVEHAVLPNFNERVAVTAWYR